MLFQCWAIVKDGGSTLKQHWLSASSLLDAYVHRSSIATLPKMFICFTLKCRTPFKMP